MELKLTTKQTDLLFEVCEAHMKWYKAYYTDPPKFEILLELNHTKLSFLINEKTTEHEITDILVKMKSSFETMIKDYSPNT